MKWFINVDECRADNETKKSAQNAIKTFASLSLKRTLVASESPRMNNMTFLLVARKFSTVIT